MLSVDEQKNMEDSNPARTEGMVEQETCGLIRI
jgi:hypothetical protein